MTDGEVSARDGAVSASVPPALNIAGQSTIRDLLALQSVAPERSFIGRLFGVNPLGVGSRSTYRAAIGEIEVGAALDALGDGWTVLHSVPVGEGGAYIDHLVIGPGGVYIVNTTVHSGGQVWASQRTFMVGDIRYPFIRNMEYEMGRVERLLSTAADRPVEVSGILAVVDPKALVVREAHRDVAVLQASGVSRWIRGRARVMLPDDVEVIAEAALVASTWHEPAPVADDPVSLRARFETLHTQVTRAWNVQKIWATVATALAAGGFILVTYTILINALTP